MFPFKQWQGDEHSRGEKESNGYDSVHERHNGAGMFGTQHAYHMYMINGRCTPMATTDGIGVGRDIRACACEERWITEQV